MSQESSLDSSPEEQRKQSTLRLRSPIWKHFNLSEDFNEAYCKYCSYAIKYNTKSGTGNLNNHYNSKHRNQLSNNEDTNKSILSSCFINKEQLELQIVKWIAINMHPFTIIEEGEFLNLINMINSNVQIPSSDVIRRRFNDIYIEKKDELIKIFDEIDTKISFTLDVWTSSSAKSFLGVTAHFISEDWRLESILIDFINLGESHSGEALAKFFIQTIMDFNIEEKIFSITTDNGTNNDTFVDALTDWAKNNFSDFNPNQRMRCFAHILNLAVQDSYTSIISLIADLRSKIAFINNSSKQKERFLKILEKNNKKKGLISDVITRWNSTYDMLNRALELKEEINEFFQSETIDWLVIERVISFLKPFKDVTMHISASSYPTLNNVVPLFFQLITFTKSINNSKQIIEIRNAAENCLCVLNKYLEKITATHLIASVLDPRLKMIYFEEQKKKFPTHFNELKKQIITVFNNYRANISRSSSENEEVNSIIDDIYKKRKIDPECELNDYLISPLSHKDEYPLNFWKQNSHRYPVLSKMAKDYLAVPGTSVPCECVFSRASHILNKKRNRLRGDTMREIMCLNRWLT